MSEKQDKKLEAMRHSAEHVLTQAMLKLHPGLKMAMGPATEDGFYFDFDFKGKISEGDFPKIEEEMKKIIKKDLAFKKENLTIEEARKLFKNNEYKQEWLDEIEEKKEKVVAYWTGDDFVDLCSGPHLASTGKIGPFKLLSIAGAYWRGDEKNKMLARIYGTAFSTQKELDEYLRKREEAKKRDHRKLGKELGLFAFDDMSGPGLALWLPKGDIVREELENWAKKTEKEWGYQKVSTPHIGRRVLYETSSHLPYYEESMYPPMHLSEKKEGEGDYFLKAMNCPHHHLIYASRMRSYKELPLRLAEYGMTYRYEQSGELHGLMRVRGFCVNDAHIYCTQEQAKEEFVKVLELHAYYYKALGIDDYFIELGLRDPQNKSKYHGNESMWKESEKITKKAMKEFGIEYVEKEGAAAFYGSKADFQIRTVTGKLFTASTNQIDFYMPERFKLKYIGQDGKEHRPVVIHRAPLGSHERFIGFLIEHYAGAFPVWLSPVQVKILPVTERNIKYTQSVAEKLKNEGIRFGVDERNETLPAKIRDAQLEKVPYMIIVGDKEEKAKKISLRLRSEKDLGQMSIAKFIAKIKDKIETKALDLI